ncbi:hypothetical protein TNCV_4031591 [Trichonephila clavipes]|nr:hypothetical protein TNCV_4031591 [Trichonephila clavipes]
MRQANQQFSSILSKIGNGEQLDEMEIALIESRFCIVEEAEARCPQDKFDDDIQKVTPARAPLAFFFLSHSALMSKSFSSCFSCACARRLPCFWLHAITAILTVRCPQRYFHGDQRRI